MGLLEHIEPYVHAACKVACAWLLILYGAITLQHVCMTLGGIYSAMQIYVLWRDKFRNRKTD